MVILGMQKSLNSAVNRLRKLGRLIFSKSIFVHANANSWINKTGKIDESTTYSGLFSEESEGCLKWNHFSTIYDELLGQYRSKINLKVLEIGVQYGGSQRILRKYFHNSATITGIDIDDNCLNIDTGTNLRIGSSRDENFLKSIVEEMGGIDIVIDDGSHRSSDQKISFEILFPLLSNNGLYIVEDLEHSYFWQSGGVPYLPNTFLNYAKRTTELLNNTFRIYPKLGTLKLDHSDLFSIKFYPQLIAFQKLTRNNLFVSKVGHQYPEGSNGPQ
jgi:23S rRNA U2552 (ribose-2'-O)-methylase RlmE/FtsJ